VRYGAVTALVLLGVLAIVASVEIRGVGLSDAIGEFAPSAGSSLPDDGNQVVEGVTVQVGDWFAFQIEVPSHGSLSMDVHDVVLVNDRAHGQELLPLSDIRTTTRLPAAMTQKAWDEASPWNGHWPHGATETLVIRVPVTSCPVQISSLRFDVSVLGVPQHYTVALGTQMRVRPIGGSCRPG
jgi:hypothetical protein